jgi:hypothetical protein
MEESRKSLRVADHEGLAARISGIENDLERIREEIADVYGERARSMIRDISRSVEALRSFLDTRVFVENPTREGAANAAVYYAGGPKRGCGGTGGCQGGCDCGDRGADSPCAEASGAMLVGTIGANPGPDMDRPETDQKD